MAEPTAIFGFYLRSDRVEITSLRTETTITVFQNQYSKCQAILNRLQTTIAQQKPNIRKPNFMTDGAWGEQHTFQAMGGKVHLRTDLALTRSEFTLLHTLSQ